jgi:hypothetical protein
MVSDGCAVGAWSVYALGACRARVTSDVLHHADTAALVCIAERRKPPRRGSDGDGGEGGGIELQPTNYSLLSIPQASIREGHLPEDSPHTREPVHSHVARARGIAGPHGAQTPQEAQGPPGNNGLAGAPATKLSVLDDLDGDVVRSTGGSPLLPVDQRLFC